MRELGNLIMGEWDNLIMRECRNYQISRLGNYQILLTSALRSAIRSFILRQLGPMRRFIPLSTT